MSTLAERIRQARESVGMSQAELARHIGASANGLNMLETGRIHNPRILRIVALAHALKVSSDFLLGIDTKDNKDAV